MTLKKVLGLVAASLFSLGANAGLIFQDNFDTEAGAAGNSALNYTGFANWTVPEGTVDIVANAGFGIRCAGNTGKCVDLDGSSSNAGTFTSSLISLGVGDYILSFDISGNQRGGASDSTLLTLGGFINETISGSSSLPWTTITRSFSIGSATTNSLVFNHAGGDNVGLILDNVVLTKVRNVPEPAPLALLGLSLFGLGIARRKVRK